MQKSYEVGQVVNIGIYIVFITRNSEKRRQKLKKSMVRS